MDPVDNVIIANSPEHAERILILDAPELVPEAERRGESVVIWCDDVRDRDRARQLAGDTTTVLDEPDFAGEVDLAWFRLPKALGTLDEYAQWIAALANSDTLVLAGARERHLNRSMNDVLALYFDDVSASLGQQKSRALRATGRKPGVEGAAWPRHKRHTDVQIGSQKRSFTLWTHGATFAAAKVDLGTALLLQNFDRIAEADRYLDLGSGNGVIATNLARTYPNSQVFAVDASWAAVDATRRTAETNKTSVEVTWAANLAGFDDGSLDVIVCNPPFHRGVAKESGPTLALFSDAARALGAGGEFWCVFNSHLPWKAQLTKRVGPTTVVAQDTGYTLTRSVKE